MSKIKFNRTHRVLIKATEGNHGYDTYEIDINSGLFRKVTVKSNLTKIRVKQQIFGEYFYDGSKTAECSIDDIKRIEKLFNNVRKSLEWPEMTFRKEVKEENENMSNTSEVQG